MLTRARSRSGSRLAKNTSPSADLRSGAGIDERDPALLAASIDKWVLNKGWDLNVAVGSLKGMWPEIVGTSVAEHVVIEAFELDATGMSGTLILRASSTAWASQMRLLLPTMRDKLDDAVGAGRVGEIIVNGPTAPSWKHGYRSVPGRGPRDTYG